MLEQRVEQEQLASALTPCTLTGSFGGSAKADFLYYKDDLKKLVYFLISELNQSQIKSDLQTSHFLLQTVPSVWSS